MSHYFYLEVDGYKDGINLDARDLITNSQATHIAGIVVNKA
jgi:hypothetical protein